jgi:hypothetical protein
MTKTDTDTINFFTDSDVVADPFPYLDALRQECPVRREPHHKVMMVTGYDEALQVYNDADSFSSCTAVTGPFPGFPVPLDGKSRAEIDALITEHRHKLPAPALQRATVRSDHTAQCVEPLHHRLEGWLGRELDTRLLAQEARSPRYAPRSASRSVRTPA